MSTSPQSFEARVLSYLKAQEHLNWGEAFEEIEEEETPEQHAQAILQEILLKLNKRIVCQDRYDNLKENHNQFPLFNLEDIIPDFCIDEDMIKQLTFSETLVISELDGYKNSKETVPKAVGSLVLNILAEDAILPHNIKKKAIDADIEREVTLTLQRAKQVAGPLIKKPNAKLVELDEVEEQLRKTLIEYEKSLKEEMMANATKFTVHVSSQFNSGFNGGSRITAWVNRNFHTLEEKRTEYFQDEGIINEKTLYVGLQHRKYYVRHCSSKEETDNRRYYNLAKCQDLVCEGANFILMRYLAITRYEGQFELSTTYINGDLCRNHYECTGPMKGKVNNKETEICKIYRYIVEKCGIEHLSVTVMTVYGRIVTQEWDGCRYILNMNPLQFVGTGKPTLYDRKSLENTWYDDLELFSKYMDTKTEAELKMKSYMHEHPEVKNIIADYLNNILLLKPHNILPFTMDFFQSLCPMKIAKMKY
ncbi:ciliogenesis-associated TTC17-interacting protein-like [Diabrotica virgifera virgifera]|uniref:Ciliogenesis-associated TTC17-interacting protein N-terminal domain-containing protein n=1 Tax=Diabrotica virgifera virgifera TaxID=50390 RepID=A0ABM5JXJ2_DIAVI|nr:ciliogenesis-associated TTC17-interacting protein-like [Diabrotica virgifera virgifera]